MRKFMTIATSALLAASLLLASDAMAQTRSSQSGSSSSSRSTSSQSSRSSSSSSRSSSTSTRSSSQSSRSGSSAGVSSSAQRSSGAATSSASRSTSSASRSTSSASRSTSSAVRSTSQSTRSSSQSSRSTASSSASRSTSSASRATTQSTRSSSQSTRSSNVSRQGLTASGRSSTVATRENFRDDGGNYRYADDFSLDDSRNMVRVTPRQREPMAWDRPGHFWVDKPHFFGYRVHSLPPSWRRISHWGIDYYFHDGIYYRSYGGGYVVCRPPFGTPLEAAIDRAILRSLRFAYYCDTYRTFTRTFDYYNVIARQNLIIAQQNARLAAANKAYALNSSRALSAYELAERLGLVQSYAYANSEYFYLDGVFYTISASGAYSTIVPPAGALVTSLPDDYEVIVMNGIEYYMVDNTVYRTTLFDGQPYLEVLGQMYGSLYGQYNIYR